jgi:hypothetical protein
MQQAVGLAATPDGRDQRLGHQLAGMEEHIDQPTCQRAWRSMTVATFSREATKTSNKFRDLDRMPTGLPLLEEKKLVLDELNRGRRAERELQILKKGPRRIVPVDIDELASGTPRSLENASVSHLVDAGRKTRLEAIKRTTDPQKRRLLGPLPSMLTVSDKRPAWRRHLGPEKCHY